ncbi:tautomerase family protein [Methylobacterium sp. R2-1]|uniref:tautomerase family protein n=1 Tax=Methylobacterium sp. R2-1 TaxID=2587064 RepID=UPI0016134783|nr:tautomerase family protein [Methylobacterium sp. R2-1]MBB2965155.1 4-oxalocrotonate tautomerase [Methylobacterium sp. R2-1]
MPFVSLKIAGPEIGSATVAELQCGITALMAEVLGKRADLTAVLVEPAPAGSWAVGGEAVTLAAHVEARVTLGTNTAEEKARFVAAAHDLLMRTLPGRLPLATYVVVQEVPADAWGYGGLTQAERASDAAART